MAKKSTVKTTAPSQLVLKLNAPGMTAMHRVGLGGLAATLDNLSRRLKKPDFNKNLFNHPAWHAEFSWNIQPKKIVISFGRPEWAKDFFHWLFDFAFQIDNNKMIFLPGQHITTESHIPSIPLHVRTRLQLGLLQTILQHTKTRDLGEKRTVSYKQESMLIYDSYNEFKSYKIHKNWKELITSLTKGGEEVYLKDLEDYEIKGTIAPGAVKRHESLSKTAIRQPLGLFLPLLFVMVGAIAIPSVRGKSILVIPYVHDLKNFAIYRPSLTPNDITQTFVSSVGDAALHYELSLHGAALTGKIRSSGCDIITFTKLPWSGKQLYRNETFSISSLEDDLCDFYHTVRNYLPPRIRKRQAKNSDSENKTKSEHGKTTVTIDKNENQWKDSVIRPFIANNIVLGKYWFTGFTALMNSVDPLDRIPMRMKIAKEREGLNQMTKDETLDWKLEGARSLVLAVQEALRCCYGKAGSDASVSETGNQKRLEKEYEKWRFAFSGAKTEEQFRYSLGDMFSRAKNVPELKTAWKAITKLLLSDWQSARDLALIGLASYKGKENVDDTENDPSEDE